MGGWRSHGLEGGMEGDIKSIKRGLLRIDCQLTADKGRGGGDYENIYKAL